MIDFEIIPADPRNPRLQDLWSDLAESSGASFFLSWPVVRAWLSHLPADHQVKLLTGRKGDAVHIACLLGSSSFSRRMLFGGQGLYLNTSGRSETDFLYIEYNDPLIHPDADPTVCLTALFDFLLNRCPDKWDEFYLPGLTENSRISAFLEKHCPRGLVLEVGKDTRAPYVDLQSVRRAGGNYDTALSPNTRRQIRQSIRAYEKRGPLGIEIAETPEEGLNYFEQLTDLHQAAWQARGESGAFGTDQAIAFHRNLIQDRFTSGQVQLIRLCCGETTLGCFYHFVYGQRVLFYQSGLVYEEDNKLRPGLIAHYLMVRHYLAAGLRVYDFLAGPTRYKTSLSTDAAPMRWLRLQRPRLRFRLERFLRSPSLKRNA